MAKKTLPKNKHMGYFAYVETEFLDEEKQVKRRRFEKTGCLEYTKDEALRQAKLAHPARRVKVMGVKLPTGSYIDFKPHKDDPADYVCFSSSRGYAT
jgi:hypothetical protein